MKVLSLDRVTRRFGDFVAVNDLSFSIDEGQVVGFLGANGAGKTTTLRMILDILPPTSGVIEVLGGPPGRDKAAEIGFLPEERGLYRGMTALQTVIYFGQLKGLSRAAARDAAIPLLDRFGLGSFAGRRVDRLSKGMAQKVQLATALVNSPKLLLLDEPFSGLDPVNQAVLQDEILAAARRGSNILFSTHVMEHAERLCTRLIMLARGQKVFDGDRKQASAMLPGSVRVCAKTDPSSLPGVARAERLATGVQENQDGWTDWQIVLKPGTEPGDLLQACVETGFALRGFEAHSATLHDVFLHLAGPPEQSPEPVEVRQ
ncbi:MAG TPA: ATP-binding cassette domain-containing protein [Bryobacteraceae bacterium]|jgi:ABC-2 type transport system ATP-binding protein|nr:ATP-binding cassette domain-containing protein [Bryobacteraceae bacterium]